MCKKIFFLLFCSCIGAIVCANNYPETLSVSSNLSDNNNEQQEQQKQQQQDNLIENSERYIRSLFNNNNNNYINNNINKNSDDSVCNPNKLVIYKIILETYWSRELFPKHYPDWRPPAQWTKTFGRSHSKNFSLFKIGEKASAGVKAFVETGRADLLEETNKQNATKIFDEFSLPAILSGSGNSNGNVFVDGNHSRISLITRIVPSPDWFIGVDSFELCIGGSWLDSITIEMDPLDAGTDNGFTFTAPNWPTEPQGIIYRIMSRYPSHPAGSFYYPQNKRLPPIATIQIIKLKEYELTEVYHHGASNNNIEIVNNNNNQNINNNKEMINELSKLNELERENDVTNVVKPQQQQHKNQEKQQNDKERLRLSLLEKLNFNSTNNETTVQQLIPKNNKNALLNNIIHNYGLKMENRGNFKRNRNNHHHQQQQQQKIRPPRDCRVSHWSDWSNCSKTCGIGEMHRLRKVIKHAKRGGRSCPVLQESKWCGSARDCNTPDNYFQW